MSYNIHHGEGLDSKVDLQRIAELIKQEQADIVGLQEVDKGTERTQRRDFPAELAVLTGMTCVFSNNYHFQGGEYGNAILTRFPVKSVTNSLYKMLIPGEQRGILQVVLEVRGRDLVFMNTHIDYRPDDRERLSNTAEIRAFIKQYSGKPIILCGDFNDVRSSRTYQALSELFIDAWQVAGTGDGNTIPAAKPAKRIDYIWLSKGSDLTPLKVWVPRSEASDHLPLVAEIR
jgi:endonuclease/exonuclease/phosphatase family metal-dependent hydrolase